MKTTFYRVNEAGEAVEKDGQTYYAPLDHRLPLTGRAYLRRRWQRMMRERIARRKMMEGRED